MAMEYKELRRRNPPAARPNIKISRQALIGSKPGIRGEVMASNAPQKEDRLTGLRRRAEIQPSDDESDGEGGGSFERGARLDSGSAGDGGGGDEAYESNDYDGRDSGDYWDDEEEEGEDGPSYGAGDGDRKESSARGEPDSEQSQSISERLSKLSHGAGPSRRKRSHGFSGNLQTKTDNTERAKNAPSIVSAGKSSDPGSGQPKARSRANKNRPQEASSLRAVGRFREVVPVKRKNSRDPRFEGGGGSGKLNYDLFRKAYGFLATYQDGEIEELKKSLKKEKNQERSARLQGLLTRLQQERAERSQGDRARTAIRETKKKEREAVAAGKKPFFLKGSERKKLSLEQRYEGLKEEGKLANFMEKKRKRNAAKDHRWLPSKRQDRG